VAATYWNQSGEFEDLATPVFRNGRDKFWLVDASISYRLPRRNGFVSIGATNLFNKRFNYYEVDFKNPAIQPDRVIFVRLTLPLP
jgi:outer membrane receptor protein involved in Fe transport